MPTLNLGRNVECTAEGSKLMIGINLDNGPGEISTSGKNVTLATTGGAQFAGSLPDGRGVKITLTAYTDVPESMRDEAAVKRAAYEIAKVAKK